MPVIDHPTNASTRQGAAFRYGCHGKPRPVAGALLTGSPAYGSQTWPFRMSTECRYDMSLTDPACEGCPHRGSGEEYDRKIREVMS